MTTSDDSPGALHGPPCPKCQSDATVHTYERFSEHFFYCPDCDHHWSVVKSSFPKIDPQPPSE